MASIERNFYWMFFFLLPALFFASENKFQKTKIKDARQYYQLMEKSRAFEQLCDVYRSNVGLWIEPTIEDLVKNIHIRRSDTDEDDNSRFHIEYFFQAEDESGLIDNKMKFHLLIHPFGKTTEADGRDDDAKVNSENYIYFEKLCEKEIPPLKNNHFSLMQLKTIMLSYGYLWLKTEFQHLGSPEKKENWRSMAALYLQNLQKPDYIYQFRFSEMVKDLTINFENDFQDKMMDTIEEDSRDLEEQSQKSSPLLDTRNIIPVADDIPKTIPQNNNWGKRKQQKQQNKHTYHVPSPQKFQYSNPMTMATTQQNKYIFHAPSTPTTFHNPMMSNFQYQGYQNMNFPYNHNYSFRPSPYYENFKPTPYYQNFIDMNTKQHKTSYHIPFYGFYYKPYFENNNKNNNFKK